LIAFSNQKNLSESNGSSFAVIEMFAKAHLGEIFNECLARPCVTCELGAGTGIRTQLEGSTVPQDNHYPIPARHNGSLLRGDKTFPAVGSPGDIHHQRDKILQAVNVVDAAQAGQSFFHMLIPVSPVDAEEHEIARLRGLFDIISFLVEVLNMRVGDVGASREELHHHILHGVKISRPGKGQILFAEIYGRDLNAVALIAIPAPKVPLQAQNGQHHFVLAKVEARGIVQGRVIFDEYLAMKWEAMPNMAR
jgi:hypothetical protein